MYLEVSKVFRVMAPFELLFARVDKQISLRYEILGEVLSVDIGCSSPYNNSLWAKDFHCVPPFASSFHCVLSSSSGMPVTVILDQCYFANIHT
jgi:hypothetical protein